MKAKEKEDKAYLKWVSQKHRRDAFQKALVDACTLDFANHPVLDDEQRAVIYTRIRQNLQRDQDRRLRIHAAIPCNS